MEPHKPAIKWSPTFFLHSTSSSSLALVLDISCSSSSRISCRSSSRLAARASIASLRKNKRTCQFTLVEQYFTWTWYMHGTFFFFQFSTEHIILYSSVNWYLNHTCFFAILLAWPVFAFNILITFRCIYTVKHVWKYLRCLFQ